MNEDKTTGTNVPTEPAEYWLNPEWIAEWNLHTWLPSSPLWNNLYEEYLEHKLTEKANGATSLAKALADKDKRIAELEQQLAEARKDGERLEWLMSDTVNCPTSMWLTISRQAIDEAMKGADA